MRILDPRFKYVPAARTDIRKTFARIRKEQELQKEQQSKVTQMRRANGNR